ncbi:hypothetical protein D3C71_2027480 [compost metagenome]
MAGAIQSTFLKMNADSSLKFNPLAFDNGDCTVGQWIVRIFTVIPTAKNGLTLQVDVWRTFQVFKRNQATLAVDFFDLRQRPHQLPKLGIRIAQLDPITLA